EADLLSGVPQHDEVRRFHPPGDRMVPGRGTQVLSDRDEIAPGIVQILQRRDDLLVGLAHAEDEVRLRHQTGLAGLGDHGQRALVAEAGRIRLKMRGTVSTLWASTSGREEKTSASWSSAESKSGISSSTPVPAPSACSIAWMRRTVSA